MSRSSNTSRYGSLAERKAAEKWGLRLDGAHTAWCDAVDRDGTPWEIKAAMIERADGSEGRFRVFEEYHDKLVREGGRYGFLAYKPRGRGITVVKSRAIPAEQLPVARWYGTGGHRDSRQVKLDICDLI